MLQRHPRPRPATSALTASAWPSPNSSAAAPPGRRSRGSSAIRRRMHSRPSLPPSSAMRGSAAIATSARLSGAAVSSRCPARWKRAASFAASTSAVGTYGRLATRRSRCGGSPGARPARSGSARSPCKNVTRDATPERSAFARATASASPERSVAVKRSGTGDSVTRASAIAPLPVPISAAFSG